MIPHGTTVNMAVMIRSDRLRPVNMDVSLVVVSQNWDGDPMLQCPALNGRI